MITRGVCAETRQVQVFDALMFTFWNKWVFISYVQYTRTTPLPSSLKNAENIKCAFSL